ncbi:Antithrombin-III [Thelohanellus kitauei]|uniref:Antithrombin-III n=1 Tax=Thelohanellus kitauei TaxID=669202 RepID=A0A0C2MYI1_THEKT|nr:Antithrombin-III [Thelohanellus kitauei]
MLGAISIGLRTNSYYQLSEFMGENFEEIFTETGRYSNTARRWFYVQKLSQLLPIQSSALFHSMKLYNFYEDVSGLLFNLHKIKVDFSNKGQSTNILNEWVKYRTFGSMPHIFNGLMLNKNSMLFIHTLSYHVDWVTNFDSRQSSTDIFYNDDRIGYLVNMMNQESVNKLYSLRQNNFRILFQPLKQSDLVSAIVLPRQFYNLKDIRQNFQVCLYLMKVNKMDIYYKASKFGNIKLKLPKFKIRRHDYFDEILKNFGIIDIFDPDLSDLGTMTNTMSLLEI